jgi:hypothetical protein
MSGGGPAHPSITSWSGRAAAARSAPHRPGRRPLQGHRRSRTAVRPALLVEVVAPGPGGPVVQQPAPSRRRSGWRRPGQVAQLDGADPVVAGDELGQRAGRGDVRRGDVEDLVAGRSDPAASSSASARSAGLTTQSVHRLPAMTTRGTGGAVPRRHRVRCCSAGTEAAPRRPGRRTGRPAPHTAHHRGPPRRRPGPRAGRRRSGRGWSRAQHARAPPTSGSPCRRSPSWATPTSTPRDALRSLDNTRLARPSTACSTTAPRSTGSCSGRHPSTSRPR